VKNHRLPAQDLPILAKVDVVVIGGTFAGLSSALKFANQGKRVLVVESRTYLGSELTATPVLGLHQRKQLCQCHDAA
jgi:flavin-dependent dehydrogenase